MAEGSLDTADIVTMVVYFGLVLAVGLWATIKSTRGSSQGYFLAGKSMTFLPIAGSIFASNIGSPTMVGLAGSGAATGFAPVMFEWHATYTLMLLGWLFVPIYLAAGTSTMPEYLKMRFGGKRLRIYYACVQLFLIIVLGITAELYAGSLFIEQLLGWNIYLSTIILLVITAFYTVAGGLAAVIYTDALQAVILIVGCFVICGYALVAVGGYENMLRLYTMSASNESYLYQTLYFNRSCGFPPHDAFHIMRAMNSSYPWPGLVFGLTLLATYYWCTNQVIVQRNLSAKSVIHSKAACIVASYLKVLPFFLFVWPGMISRILFPHEIACSDPDTCERICSNRNGCSNIAFPLLVLRLLPVGLKGLMLSAMLSALMSSLTSQFNSSSTMFTLDIYKYFRPKAGDKEEVIVGRVFGACLVGLSIAWLPVLKEIQGSQLWDYLQSISSYVTPPWVVVFVLGMFWDRCTEQGAWWGLMAGLVVGLTRMGIHFSQTDPQCGSPELDTRLPIYANVHYLMFACILAAVSLIVVVAVSVMTQPRQTKQLRRVTWWTKYAAEPPELTDEEQSDDDNEPPNEENTREISVLRKAYNCMCGFKTAKAPKLSKTEKEQLWLKLTNIQEDPLWSKICNINGVIVVAVTCFLIGFYA